MFLQLFFVVHPLGFKILPIYPENIPTQSNPERVQCRITIKILGDNIERGCEQMYQQNQIQEPKF
jgi:hypothetical protein